MLISHGNYKLNNILHAYITLKIDVFELLFVNLLGLLLFGGLNIVESILMSSPPDRKSVV